MLLKPEAMWLCETTQDVYALAIISRPLFEIKCFRLVGRAGGHASRLASPSSDLWYLFFSSNKKLSTFQWVEFQFSFRRTVVTYSFKKNICGVGKHCWTETELLNA